MMRFIGMFFRAIIRGAGFTIGRDIIRSIWR